MDDPYEHAQGESNDGFGKSVLSLIDSWRGHLRNALWPLLRLTTWFLTLGTVVTVAIITSAGRLTLDDRPDIATNATPTGQTAPTTAQEKPDNPPPQSPPPAIAGVVKQIVDFAIGAAVFLFVGAGVCLGCYLAFFLILACNKEGVLMLEPDPDVRAKRTLGAVIALQSSPRFNRPAGGLSGDPHVADDPHPTLSGDPTAVREGADPSAVASAEIKPSGEQSKPEKST